MAAPFAAARVGDPVGAHGGSGSGASILKSALGYAALGVVGVALVVAAVAAAPAIIAGVAAGAAIGATAMAAGTAVVASVSTLGGALAAGTAIVGVGLSAAAQGIGAARKDAGSAPMGGGCSKIVVGSENVFIECKPASRAGLDKNAHGPPKKLKTGSSTVSINNRPASRIADGSTCGGKVIDGADYTFIYGPPATEVGERRLGVIPGAAPAGGEGLDGVDWEAWENGLGMAGLALGLATGGFALAGVVRGAGGLRAAFATKEGLTKVGVFGAQVGAGVAGGEALSKGGGAIGGVAVSVIGEAVSNAIPAHRIGKGLALPKGAPKAPTSAEHPGSTGDGPEIAWGQPSAPRPDDARISISHISPDGSEARVVNASPFNDAQRGGGTADRPSASPVRPKPSDNPRSNDYAWSNEKLAADMDNRAANSANPAEAARHRAAADLARGRAAASREHYASTGVENPPPELVRAHNERLNATRTPDVPEGGTGAGRDASDPAQGSPFRDSPSTNTSGDAPPTSRVEPAMSREEALKIFRSDPQAYDSYVSQAKALGWNPAGHANEPDNFEVLATIVQKKIPCPKTDYGYHGTSEARLASLQEHGLNSSVSENATAGGTRLEGANFAGDAGHAQSYAEMAGSADKSNPLLLRFELEKPVSVDHIGATPPIPPERLQLSRDGGKTWEPVRTQQTQESAAAPCAACQAGPSPAETRVAATAAKLNASASAHEMFAPPEAHKAPPSKDEVTDQARRFIEARMAKGEAPRKILADMHSMTETLKANPNTPKAQLEHAYGLTHAAAVMTAKHELSHPIPTNNRVNPFVGAFPNQIRLAGARNIDPRLGQLEPLPGVTDVIVHGTKDNGFEVLRKPGLRDAHIFETNNDWQGRVADINPKTGLQTVSPEHFARILQRLGVEGDVRLISCETGALDNGTAARLAKVWDGKIYAPKQDVTVRLDPDLKGKITNTEGREADYRVFERGPDGEVTAKKYDLDAPGTRVIDAAVEPAASPPPARDQALTPAQEAQARQASGQQERQAALRNTGDGEGPAQAQTQQQQQANAGGRKALTQDELMAAYAEAYGGAPAGAVATPASGALGTNARTLEGASVPVMGDDGAPLALGKLFNGTGSKGVIYDLSGPVQGKEAVLKHATQFTDLKAESVTGEARLADAGIRRAELLAADSEGKWMITEKVKGLSGSEAKSLLSGEMEQATFARAVEQGRVDPSFTYESYKTKLAEDLGQTFAKARDGKVPLDLKPDNFVVNKNGEYVLVDRGLASDAWTSGATSPDTWAQNMMGTRDPKVLSDFQRGAARPSGKGGSPAAGQAAPCAACSAGAAPSAVSTAQAAAGGLKPGLFVPKNPPPGVSANPFARRVKLTSYQSPSYKMTADEIASQFEVSSDQADLFAKLHEFQNLDVNAVGPGNARRIAHLQELEGRVQSRVAGDGVAPHEALETELREMEHRHGFGEPADLTEALSPDDFLAVVRRGQPVRDVVFAQGHLARPENVFHGQQVHRIQWWAIARELEVNPGAFGEGQSAIDLYRMTGSATKQSYAGSLWTELFDIGPREPTMPTSSIWQAHQMSPAYRLSMNAEARAGQLPGLYSADHPPGGATVKPVSEPVPREPAPRSFLAGVKRFFSGS